MYQQDDEVKQNFGNTAVKREIVSHLIQHCLAAEILAYLLFVEIYHKTIMSTDEIGAKMCLS